MHGDVNPQNFEIGRVVSRTFNVLIRNMATFLALTALLTAPILLVSFYSVRNNPLATAVAAGRAIAPSQLGQNLGMTLLAALVNAVFYYMLQASLVQGTLTDLNGERPNLGACLATGFKAFLPLIAITILSYLGIFGAMILLVVPGIMLGLAWVVVVPVRVVEHIGIFESFGRSRALTKGHRWKILGLLLIYLAIAFLVQMALGAVFAVSLFRPGAGALAAPFMLVSWAVRIPLAAVAAVGVASLYFELRLIKEGAGPAQLAAAFD